MHIQEDDKQKLRNKFSALKQTSQFPTMLTNYVGDLMPRSMFGDTFGDFFGPLTRPMETPRFVNMPLDIAEHNDRYEITAELPGLNKEDINIELDDNDSTLVISAKRESRLESGSDVKGSAAEKSEGKTQEQPGVRWHRTERRFGSVCRRLALPEDVDPSQINAEYVNGVLQLSLQKREPQTTEAKKRRIALS